MKKQEIYVVAEASDTSDLAEVVFYWINKGFVCQGGIYCNGFFFKRYYQAMVKYED